MKHVLEYLASQNEGMSVSKVGRVAFLILLALAMVVGLYTMGRIAFEAFDHSAKRHVINQAKEQKATCTGEFDTIPCHQLRIEHLLRESYKQRTEQ
jgi:hypothetical protein